MLHRRFDKVPGVKSSSNFAKKTKTNALLDGSKMRKKVFASKIGSVLEQENLHHLEQFRVRSCFK